MNNQPKLTLGLRRKKDNFSAERPSKLTLGLRRKPMLMQSDHGIEPIRNNSFEKKFRPMEPSLVSRANTIKIPKTQGRLEVNIKITQLPNWVESIKNGWRLVYINADNCLVQIKIRPKTWNKLIQADEEYSEWVATISGKMGMKIKNGFELLEPAIQVYENQKPIDEDSPELSNIDID
ncbi:hypothetical protein QUF74_14855 [Candidatus Halobeggiatoa sp. HSG11]|nr:hypothetical protein [Candidatus Halobeggiatoa sp. HSG11]